MLRDFLRPDDLCYTLQMEIIPRIKLADFETMYSEKGRPPVSPVVLLVILILQYIEGLSDRAAASNLRFRLDWKIALGLELDYEGIHPTTLVYFRDRLLNNEQASYAFDQVLEHLKEISLVSVLKSRFSALFSLRRCRLDQSITTKFLVVHCPVLQTPCLDNRNPLQFNLHASFGCQRSVSLEQASPS